MSTMFAAVAMITASMTGLAPASLSPQLVKYVQSRTSEFESIPAERRTQLQPLVDFVTRQAAAGQPVRLTFICTHNSRRSHLSQVWARTAAAYYGVPNVETFSGGTEATAFNPRAIAALRRAGFEISEGEGLTNPRYEVKWASTAEPMACFSKVYSHESNPQKGFAAVMTCTQADRACPIVQGADVRIAIPFDDPKVSDGTPEESKIYDERTAQIARELLFVFSEVQKAQTKAKVQ